MTSGRAWIVGCVVGGVAAGALVARLDPIARTCALLAPFAAAAVIDARTRRIPNALSAGTLALALAVAVVERALLEATAGAAVALLVGMALAVAARGAFGMGDVKLMAGAGAVAGMAHVLAFLFAMSLAGGAIALVTLAARRGRSATMPYAPAIALGVADVVLLVAPR